MSCNQQSQLVDEALTLSDYDLVAFYVEHPDILNGDEDNVNRKKLSQRIFDLPVSVIYSAYVCGVIDSSSTSGIELLKRCRSNISFVFDSHNRFTPSIDSLEAKVHVKMYGVDEVRWYFRDLKDGFENILNYPKYVQDTVLAEAYTYERFGLIQVMQGDSGVLEYVKKTGFSAGLVKFISDYRTPAQLSFDLVELLPDEVVAQCPDFVQCTFRERVHRIMQSSVPVSINVLYMWRLNNSIEEGSFLKRLKTYSLDDLLRFDSKGRKDSVVSQIYAMTIKKVKTDEQYKKAAVYFQNDVATLELLRKKAQII